jgi:putative methylase
MVLSTKKQLAIVLSQLKGFKEPKIKLEQYVTEADIAAEIAWNMLYRREIEGKVIADLGSGTGVLGLAVLMLGAKKVFFVDIDEKAIEVAKENLTFLEEKLSIKLKKKAVFVNKDVQFFDEKVDIVVQNPPFGIQGERHADRMFLERAFAISDVVYSFHKAESKQFIAKFSDDKGFKATGYWEFDWPLKQTMKFHEKRLQRIKVGCWRLERKP